MLLLNVYWRKRSWNYIVCKITSPNLENLTSCLHDLLLLITLGLQDTKSGFGISRRPFWAFGSGFPFDVNGLKSLISTWTIVAKHVHFYSIWCIYLDGCTADVSCFSPNDLGIVSIFVLLDFCRSFDKMNRRILIFLYNHKTNYLLVWFPGTRSKSFNFIVPTCFNLISPCSYITGRSSILTVRMKSTCYFQVGIIQWNFF